MASERKWGTVRASWFDTQVNRPITAVTINPKSSPILLMRENLGQIESRGVSIDFEIAPRRWLDVDGGHKGLKICAASMKKLSLLDDQG